MTVSSPDRSTHAARAMRRWWAKLSCTTCWSRAVLGLVAAAAVASSLISVPGLSGVLGAGLGLMMLAIAMIDARYFIIPNALTATAFALALLHAAVQASPDSQALLPALGAALGLAIGRAAALALFFLLVQHGYRAIRGRDGLGLGDVKLAGVAGAWLDWVMMPVAIELAAVAALLVYLLRQRALNRAVAATHRLPFGLFLAPAIWLCWVIEARWPQVF